MHCCCDTICSMNSERYTNKDFHKALIELLDKYHLSRAKLGREIGTSGAYISYLINKPKEYPPTKDNMERIAEVFDMKPDYFKEYRQIESQERAREVVKLYPDIAKYFRELVPVVAKIPTKKEVTMRPKEFLPSVIKADMAVDVVQDFPSLKIFAGDTVLFKEGAPDIGNIILTRIKGILTLARFDGSQEALGVKVGKFERGKD